MDSGVAVHVSLAALRLEAREGVINCRAFCLDMDKGQPSSLTLYHSSNCVAAIIVIIIQGFTWYNSRYAITLVFICVRKFSVKSRHDCPGRRFVHKKNEFLLKVFLGRKRLPPFSMIQILKYDMNFKFCAFKVHYYNQYDICK